MLCYSNKGEKVFLFLVLKGKKALTNYHSKDKRKLQIYKHHSLWITRRTFKLTLVGSGHSSKIKQTKAAPRESSKGIAKIQDLTTFSHPSSANKPKLKNFTRLVCWTKRLNFLTGPGLEPLVSTKLHWQKIIIIIIVSTSSTK